MTKCPEWAESYSQQQEDLLGARSQSLLFAACNPPAIINCAVLKYWHETLFAGLCPAYYYLGNFRGCGAHACINRNNQVGGIPGTRYEIVAETMGLFESDIADRLQRLPRTIMPVREHLSLIAAFVADIVGTFIRIHPFWNGNGRVSRIIWAALLAHFDVPPQFRVFPRPEEPYSLLMARSMAGDDRPLSEYILRGFLARDNLARLMAALRQAQVAEQT